MTDLLTRAQPSLRPSAPDVPPPGWLVGALAGLAAASVGVVLGMGLAVLAWFGGSGGSIGAALRAGATGWLVSHGSGVDVPGARVGVIPLGGTVLMLLLVWVCAHRAARMASGDGRTVSVLALATGGGYAVAVLVVAELARSPQVGVPIGWVVALGFLLATAAAALGAARATEWDRELFLQLPEASQVALRGAAAGIAALVGCAALLLAASLAAHLAALEAMLGSLRLGVLGGAALVLACVLFLPNAVLLSVSVLLGPGLVLGAGSSVTLGAVQVGAVPAVPWFAAVPSPGAMPLPAAVMVALPALCGAVAGAVAVQARPVTGVLAGLYRGGLAGVVAGVGVAVAVALSGGPLGPGRMADFGGQAACTVVAVAALGLGGLAGGVAARLATTP